METPPAPDPATEMTVIKSKLNEVIGLLNALVQHQQAVAQALQGANPQGLIATVMAQYGKQIADSEGRSKQTFAFAKGAYMLLLEHDPEAAKRLKTLLEAK